MVFLNTHGHFLAGSDGSGDGDNNLGNGRPDEDMGDAKRAYGSFSFDDED